jgi:hypothetical protein
MCTVKRMKILAHTNRTSPTAFPWTNKAAVDTCTFRERWLAVRGERQHAQVCAKRQPGLALQKISKLEVVPCWLGVFWGRLGLPECAAVEERHGPCWFRGTDEVSRTVCTKPPCRTGTRQIEAPQFEPTYSL